MAFGVRGLMTVALTKSLRAAAGLAIAGVSCPCEDIAAISTKFRRRDQILFDYGRPKPWLCDLEVQASTRGGIICNPNRTTSPAIHKNSDAAA
jgi:hypothetical protein